MQLRSQLQVMQLRSQLQVMQLKSQLQVMQLKSQMQVMQLRSQLQAMQLKSQLQLIHQQTPPMQSLSCFEKRTQVNQIMSELEAIGGEDASAEAELATMVDDIRRLEAQAAVLINDLEDKYSSNGIHMSQLVMYAFKGVARIY